MNKKAYENKIKAPLLYIQVVAVSAILMNLLLPVFDSDFGLSNLLQGVIIILIITLLIGTSGGFLNLKIVKSKPYPAGTWLLTRIVQILVQTIFYSFYTIQIYFWFLLLIDALLLLLVYKDYKEYGFEEKDVEEVVLPSVNKSWK